MLLLLLNCCNRAGAQQAFSFAHVSDTHIGNQTAAEDLRRTVRDINNNPALKFVVISGDITEFGADTELKLAKQILDSLRIPWHIIPGNHDDNWSESGTNSFRRVFGSETFQFTYGGYFFLGTNCGPSMRMGPGQVPHEQILWIDAMLQRLPDPRMPVIFVNHYPQDSALNNWYEVIDRLKKRNVQLILCGHGHANHAYQFEGIPGVMGRSNLRARDAVGGYNIVQVAGGIATFTERKPDTILSLKASLAAARASKVLATTQKPWTTVTLSDHHFTHDTTVYARPSYAVNLQYPHISPQWQYQDRADIGCGIARWGNLAITGNTRGEAFALDTRSGKLIWRYQTGGKIFSTPAAAKDRVVIASTDGNIYCLEAASGKLVWQFTTTGPIVASPVIDDNMIYIGSSEGHFRAISLDKGALQWDFDQVHGFVADQPLCYGGKVFFASWGNELYALNKSDGRLAWKWSNGAPNRMFSAASCVPVATGGKLFIVAPDRYMTSFNAGTGEVLWRHHWDSSWVRESMGLSQDSMLVYVKTMQGEVLGVPTTENAPRISWRSGLQLGYELDPAVIREADGAVYVPSDKGTACGADGKTGKVLWMHKIANSLINTMLPLEKGRVLVSTMDGKIVCLKTQ